MTLSGLLSRLRPVRAAAPAPTTPEPAAPEPAPVQAAYDASSVGFIDMALSGWLNEGADEVAPGYPISAEDVVVDVGAGDGGMARFCASRARETVLIDHDAERLERTVERLRSQGCERVRAQAGDAASLAVPDGYATRVICTEVLEHVDDPAQVMAELVRIGRPGALYLISVPAQVAEQLQTHVAPPLYFEKPNHIRIFDPDEFTRLVQDAGLVIEGRRTHGFFWTMYWMFFWQSGVQFGESSPVLDAWSRTWAELLRLPDGPRIKSVLDGLAPKCDAIVARKPA